MTIYTHLPSIVRQILSTFPDIFDCEDSQNLVDVACQMIKAYSYRKRLGLASKNKSTALSTTPISTTPRKRKFVMTVTVVFKFHVIF
jgi:hypothetical protein